MNKKVLNIITALVMLMAFFMPWITAFGFGGSPYQLIKQFFMNLDFVEKEPAMLLSLLLLIFPLCAIIIIIYYTKQEIKKSALGTLHFAKKTPFIFFVIVTIYSLIKMGDSAEILLDENVAEIIGIGFILTIISSLVLLIDQPKVQKFNSLDTPSQKQEPKEQANTDDLFN